MFDKQTHVINNHTTHPSPFKLHSFAFTLVETLITLGIIGIIAVFTIPILFNEYQKSQYESGLKKAYAIFSQAMKQYIITEGAENLGGTDLFDRTAFNSSGRQTNIDNAIKKIFKTVKTCKYGDDSCQMEYSYLGLSSKTNLFPATYYNFCTIDGMCFGFSLRDSCYNTDNIKGSMKGDCGYLIMDINGGKEPNKIGRDAFYFDIAPSGDIYPYYGLAYAISVSGSDDPEEYNGQYWQDYNTSCGVLGSKDVSTSSGNSCAARIIEESWQMKY